MGIRISRKTNLKATLGLLNKLCSFSFEQQYGEMEKWPPEAKEHLKKLIEALGNVV